MANSTTVSGGIGFTGLLTCIFVAAKLWGKITWSWVWVFAPMWGVWGLVLGIVALVAVFGGLMWVIGSIADIPRTRRQAKRVKERNALRDLVNKGTDNGIPKIPKSW